MLITLETVDSFARLVGFSASAAAASGARMSMLYGLVSGSSIRSNSVRIASVFGFLVCSGSESNSSSGATATAITASTANTPRIGRRWRAIIGSKGASQAKPTTAASPRGRHSVITAGRKPIVQANAINMPTPAIRPSSATPEKSVGTKPRKPAAVATAATRICTPVRAAF